LLHHLTVDLLREKLLLPQEEGRTRSGRVTWQEYEDGLEDRLTDLHGEFIVEPYRATPSRRVYKRKTDGRQRPLAVPAIEDNLSNGCGYHLNQIYEEDFLGFSYGFRRGATSIKHWMRCRTRSEAEVNYVLDADIRGFFDNSTRVWLIQFVEPSRRRSAHPTADPKWLTLGDRGRRIRTRNG